MAVTKTKFKNYSRCPRYVALDKIKKEELEADISFDEYKEEEIQSQIKEILNSMYEDEEDLIDVTNEQLKAMMPYYTKIELLAGKAVGNLFEGEPVYSAKTVAQESFDCLINGIRYICYVDIFNDRKDSFDIIEVKATTTNKFLKLGKTKNKEVISIFGKSNNNIFKLKEEIKGFKYDDELTKDVYQNNRAKLFDKYNNAGKYVYDLAIQRYIIENDLTQNGEENKIDKIKYYLAVLNKDYVFDGEYEDEEPIYPDEIISFIDLTKITKEYLYKIKIERETIEKYIRESNGAVTKIGKHCELKKQTKCKFVPVCFKDVPKKNSILNYIDNHHGFKEGDYKHDRYDLINEGKVNMLDIPYEWLTREKNKIQYDAVKNNNIYINEDKIKAGINEISYPIYHLDFETFPCPLPRFRGEKCYSQSVFQFSIHIEKEPGDCDKEKDHYGYLAKDSKDNREELVKEMLKIIDITKKGTILVYNESFEKTRIKELGKIFPEYNNDLVKLNNMIFDLMYVIKTKTSLYEALGFSNADAKMINYYHQDLNGSYSIKKVLPIFTNLSYSTLEVGNGTEAMTVYGNYDKMTSEEFEKKYNALVEYCKQDTWAMVEILKGLIKLSKSVK